MYSNNHTHFLKSDLHFFSWPPKHTAHMGSCVTLSSKPFATTPSCWSPFSHRAGFIACVHPKPCIVFSLFHICQLRVISIHFYTSPSFLKSSQGTTLDSPISWERSSDKFCFIPLETLTIVNCIN